MEETTTERVWNGHELLVPFLVAIADLEPFPDNPREGDRVATAASLRRFGQLKPIVTDGLRIIAGHHLVLGATDEGWTHIAALPNDFGDEDEQRAFMLADNATSDKAAYNETLLVQHLRALAEIDSLQGTGYTMDDLDERLANLRRTLDTPVPRQTTPQQRNPQDLKDVVLVYSAEQHAQVEEWIQAVAAVKGTHGISETIYVALELAAATVATDA